MATTMSSQAWGVLGGVGDIVSGFGSVIQGQQEREMGKYNAAIYEQQAQAERTSQQLLETQKRRILKSRIGEQTALYAKSGIKMTGSPLEVMLDSITNAELDISIDKYNSEVKARGFESSAAMAQWESKQKRNMSYFSAGKSLLSGAVEIGKALKPIGAGQTSSTKSSKTPLIESSVKSSIPLKYSKK